MHRTTYFKESTKRLLSFCKKRKYKNLKLTRTRNRTNQPMKTAGGTQNSQKTQTFHNRRYKFEVVVTPLKL